MLKLNIVTLLAVFVSLTFAHAELNAENEAVRHYLEDAVATLKLKIHKAAQRLGKERWRRSAHTSPTSNSSELQISSIDPFLLIPNNHTVEIQPFKMNGAQYIAVVNFGHSNVASEIYRMVNNNSFVLQQKFNIPGCVDFEFVDHGEKKYAVFVENVGLTWDGKMSHERHYHVYRYISPTFYRINSVATKGGTSVKSFVHGNNEYFVAANSLDDRERRDLKSTLHVRVRDGFILIQEFDTQGAEDVEVFEIDGWVYMMFANHRDDTGKVDIYSTLYRGRQKDTGYVSFEVAQKVLTHGARDFEYFKMKNDHYVVVANEYTQLISYQYNSQKGVRERTVTNDYETDSIIYWWSGKFLVEWQRIPTNGARRWLHFSGPNGEMFLAVANSRSQAVIYIYDSKLGLFKPTKVQGLLPLPSSPHLPDVRSVRGFTVNNQMFLAVANYNESRGHNLFKVKYAFEGIAEPKPNVEHVLRTALNDVSERMEKMKAWLERIREVLKKVMTLNGNETAYGNYWFKNAAIKRLRVKGNVIYTNHIENNPTERAVYRAMEIKRNLTMQSSILTELEKRLNDSVSRTGTSDVTGSKTFVGNVTFQNVTVHKMDVGKINGVNLTDVEQRAWSKSKAQVITGRNVFVNDVKILKDVSVTGKVNGIRIPEDVMTTHYDQRVTGKKMFTQPVRILGNLQTVNSTINGLRIPEDLVLRSSNQRIEGKKIFKGTMTFQNSVEVKGAVNGKDLSEFSKQVVTLSTDQVINGSKRFTNGFSVGGNLNVAGLVDGVNLTELDLDAVRMDKQETIKGKKRVFGSVTVNGNVETHSTTNGYRLQDDIMTTSTDQIINVKKTFNNVIINGDIITSSTIDGINLSTEAVTKSGDQTITGTKTFANDVVVNGNITVNGTVDGVDISEMSKNIVKTTGENVITAPKTFLGRVIVRDLSVLGKINNVNLKELRESIWTVDGNQTVTAPMTFENVQVTADLDVNGTVNGVRIPEDLIKLTQPQVIEKELIFEDTMNINGGIFFGPSSTLNGENFPKFMQSVVLNGTDQVISGKKKIENNLFVENGLVVDGKINGYQVPDDFVTLNTAQNISGKKTFVDGITVNSSLMAGIINITGTVNGVDVSKLEANAVYKGKNETISGTVRLTGNVSSSQSVTVGKLIDGVNITELMETAVRLSKPQNISGNKIFVNDVEFDKPITTPGLINNINLTAIDDNSMKKTGDQRVTGKKVFEKTVFIQRNLVNGTINGVNLEEFERQVVTKQGSEVIIGDLEFLSNVTCEMLSVEGKFDGLNLNDLMLTFGDQIIHGNKVFQGDVTVRKNVTVGGLINGVNLTKLDSEMMRITGNQNVWGELVFKNGFHANGSIHVSGFVNGVDISELSARAVRLDGLGIINGKKTFMQNVDVHGSVDFKDRVNSLNMTNLFTDVMSKSKDQVITGRKVFASEKGIRVTGGLVAEDIGVGGLVDGVNVTALDQQAVKLSDDQDLFGEYLFLNRTNFNDGIQVNGLLNGINISSDVMLTRGDQKITGTKSFKELVVNGSIEITGKIDGVDVSEFADSRVTLSTNQTIHGQLTFASNVTVKGDVILPENGTVNGLDVSEEILTTNGPLIISGDKTFTKDVEVQGDLNVTGLVAGYDIIKLNERIMYVDQSKELTGTNTFEKDLEIRGNLRVDGYVNGVNVQKVANQTEQWKTEVTQRLANINATALPICSQIKVLLALENIQIQLAGIEKSQTFSMSNGGHLDTKTIGDLVYIAVARKLQSGCGPAYILQCTSTLTCKTHQVIKTQATFVQFYDIAGETYIFAGHYGSNTTGCPVYPEILKYDKIKHLFVSLYNVTSSLYANLMGVSSNDVVVQNLASLIPYTLLTSSLFDAPITALGSLVSSPPALTRTFRVNGTVYLITASVYGDTQQLDFFILNTTTFATTKLQPIKISEVKEMDVGVIDGKVMLAVAQGRRSDNYDITIHMFVEEQKLFYFYQKIEVKAVTVRFVTIHKKFYFAYASPNHGFGLCQWQGVMGFESCVGVPVGGISHVAVLTTSDGAFTVGVREFDLILHKALFRGVSPKRNGTLTC
ncbi:uncharacterized protein LOC135696002 isoform X2 [Rhopilema esculentum]|uniref:uncharacterized protein LOC135696002 isoform X2 n=1 Tax=Rhopilema esculentum TaxID=499914 RepID=UPI0031D39C52